MAEEQRGEQRDEQAPPPAPAFGYGPPAQPQVPAQPQPQAPAQPQPQPQQAPAQWGPPPQGYGQPPQYTGQPPQYGQPAAQQWDGAAQWGGPAGPQSGPGAPGGPVGWAPPPKPGLIPLRPLTLGTILSACFLVMRRNPMPTFGLAVLLNLGALLASGGILGLVAWLTIGRSAQAGSSDDAQAIVNGGIAAGVLGSLLVVALNLVASAVVQGVLAQEVARGTVGERLTIRGLWRRLRGRVGALIGWSALIALAASIGLGLVIGLVIAVASLGESAVGGAVAIGLLGGLAFLAGAIWLGTKTCMVPAALCLERLPLRQAIARSWTLTRRSFWKTFGILALVYVIYYFASQVISFPISLVFGLAGGVLGLDSTDAATITTAGIVIYGVLLLVSVIVGAIGVVMVSATVTLLYIDLRMRREGLDLELVRFVETRSAASTGSTAAPVRDPFLPPQRVAATDGSPWA